MEEVKTPTPNHPIPIDTQLYIQELESRVKNNGWIACNERLPKNEEKVLVIDDEGIMAVCIFSPYVKRFFVAWDMEEFEDVIAWQPLPEPYKGE